MEIDNGLLDFDWDSTDVNVDTGTENVEQGVNPNNEENSEEGDNGNIDKKNKEVDPLDDFSMDEEDDTDVETENTEVTSEESSNGIFSDLYEDLKNKGIFKHVSLEDDEEITPERFFELQEEEIESQVDERLNNWASKELDDDAKAFINFKRKGGNTTDFFKVYSQTNNIPEGDIEDEDFQDQIIRYQLEQEDWDVEEIEDRIESLTDSGKKEKIAKKYFERIQKEVSKEKEELLKRQEEYKELVKQNQIKFREEVREVLNQTDNIKGFKISKKDKDGLYDFITKQQYKTEDNRTLTEFQKKLNEAFKDKDKMLLLANIVYKDFDFSSFEKSIESKKVKEVKSKLEQRKGSRSTNFGSSLGGKSLADLFD